MTSYAIWEGPDSEVLSHREIRERLASLWFTANCTPGLRQRLAEDEVRSLPELTDSIRRFTARTRAVESRPTAQVAKDFGISAVTGEGEEPDSQSAQQDAQAMAMAAAIYREMRTNATGGGKGGPGRPPPAPGGGTNPRKAQEATDKARKQCFHCHRAGHFRRDCRKWAQELKSRQQQPASAASTPEDTDNQSSAISIYDILQEQE